MPQGFKLYEITEASPGPGGGSPHDPSTFTGVDEALLGDVNNELPPTKVLEDWLVTQLLRQSSDVIRASLASCPETPGTLTEGNSA